LAEEEKKETQEQQAEEVPSEPKEPTLLDELAGRFGEEVVETTTSLGEDCAVISPSAIVSVCLWLRDGMGFRYLSDLCGADYPKREKRFEVVYHLLRHSDSKRLRLKVRVAEAESVPSVTSVWKGAEWCERECFDMFGVRFEGHPDLRRILLPEEATGHPLRKDYPVRGRDDLGYVRIQRRLRGEA